MDWHRLFGLLLTDFFTDSPFQVEIERDFSVQQQFLDVLIVRHGKGRFALRLPDGLDDLAPHNLLTLKSHLEALTGWTLHELIGHYVSYRKLVSPSLKHLLPEEDFHLYAVCARFPHNLAQEVPWQTRSPGVYDCRWGTATVRVVVARELPQQPHNAPLHLFSGSAAQVTYGGSHYQRRSAETSSLLDLLFRGYQGEGIVMPYTMQDFRQEYFKEHFTSKQKLEAMLSLSAAERREAIQSLPAEERRELLHDLPPEELLGVLSREQIEAYLQQQRQAPDTSAPKRKANRSGRKKPKN